MMRRINWALMAVLVLALTAAGQTQPAQTQEQYLDIFSVKVKPDKRAAFDAIAKKIAQANRQNSGDTWVAIEPVYGEPNTVSFISTRRSYGEIEKATDTFMGALSKAFGKAGTEKTFADLNATMVSSRGEIRRRRWDLSANAPPDPAALSKLVGESRWLRTTLVRVRPGRASEFEALLKDIKAARERATPQETSLVSQAVAGQQGTVFYITTLRPSLAGFDGGTPLQQLLGEEGFQKFQKTTAEIVLSTESVINHFLPELSNAPEEVASAAPDFWRPKVVSAKATSSSKVRPAMKKEKQ